MNTATLALAISALLPAVTGPLPLGEGSAMVLELALCNGGTISVPVNSDGPAPPVTTPCCAKGCHSRKRGAGPFDAGQGH
jgi:hypothetical protein